MDDIQVGSVVYLKSGGFAVTVTRMDRQWVSIAWMVGGVFHEHNDVPLACLTLQDLTPKSEPSLQLPPGIDAADLLRRRSQRRMDIKSQKQPDGSISMKIVEDNPSGTTSENL